MESCRGPACCSTDTTHCPLISGMTVFRIGWPRWCARAAGCKRPTAWLPLGKNPFPAKRAQCFLRHEQRLRTSARVSACAYGWHPRYDLFSRGSAVRLWLLREKARLRQRSLSPMDILMVVAQQDFRDEEFTETPARARSSRTPRGDLQQRSRRLHEREGLDPHRFGRPGDVRVDRFDGAVFVGGEGARTLFDDLGGASHRGRDEPREQGAGRYLHRSGHPRARRRAGRPQGHTSLPSMTTSR